jgi:hypothetical protein
MNYDGPAIADALARARHRIERDEALLRQALAALHWLTTADEIEEPPINTTIAALRERLEGTK